VALDTEKEKLSSIGETEPTWELGVEITWDLVQRTGIISDVKWIQSVIIYIGQGKSGNK